MKTKYDWSNVDKNVKFIAVDADGVIGGYSERPYKNKGTVWLCNESHPDSWVCNMYPFEYYPNMWNWVCILLFCENENEN